MALSNLMKQRITIKSAVITADEHGGQVTDYPTAYANVPASVQPVSGQYLVFYKQRNIEISHLIYTNQRVTIANGDLIIWGDETFYITSVRDLISLGRVIEIAAVKYVGNPPRA